jgi:hypothetical protein
MPRFWNTAFLSAALIGSIALAPAAPLADDHKPDRSYHDKERKDDHQWNDREDQAYRMWAKEKHRKYSDFSKLKERDKQTYWGWRHDHSDALLKIEIH